MLSVRKSKNNKNVSKRPHKQMNENLLIDTSNDQTDLQDDEQEAFMSFTPKTTDIQRRYTQKKPVRIDDFITKFEQERSPPLPTTPPIIIQDSLIEDEFDDFSDTARLTVNASSVSGFSRNKQPSDHRSSVQYQRTSKLYEPAIIDPEIDQRTRRLNKVIHFDKSAVIRKLSRSIRRVSKRVINVHNNNNDSISQPKQQQQHQQQQQQQHRTTVSEQPNDHDSDTSSFINEVIPLSKPISSNNPPPDSPQNTTLSHSTSYYVNPEQKDTKEYIVLSGDSLKLLSPANPFRMCLANILCWK